MNDESVESTGSDEDPVSEEDTFSGEMGLRDRLEKFASQRAYFRRENT